MRFFGKSLMRIKNSRRPMASLRVLRLEDRTLPASSITVAVGARGSGSLDTFLFDATPGTIASTDGGNTPGTLSTGALAAVAAGTSISVAAQAGISFNDLGGSLTLQTASGRMLAFNAGSGALTFANGFNTLATGGASVSASAGTNVAVCSLNTNGGDVTLVAGLSAAGNLSAGSILTGGAGNINLLATAPSGGTITQIGTAFGLSVTVTASGNVAVDSLRGTPISVNSNNGSISSVGALQSSGQLTLNAASGIAVNTACPSVQATNTASGSASITGLALPAQALTTTGTGVRNQAPGGSVSVINLGGMITVAAGSPVQTSNGAISLAGQDLNVAAAVNSGAAKTTLTTSTVGQPIDLGTNTAGMVGLTQAELNNVTAGVLQVGSTAAGLIRISAPITSPSGTLTLSSSAGITEVGSGIFPGTIKVPNLRISSMAPASAINDFNRRGNQVSEDV
jgi:hypothetical protein